MLILKQEETKYLIDATEKEVEEMLRFMISGTKGLVPGKPSSQWMVENDDRQWLDLKKKSFGIVYVRRNELNQILTYRELGHNKVEILSLITLRLNMIPLVIVYGIGGLIAALATRSIPIGLSCTTGMLLIEYLSARLSFYNRGWIHEVTDKYIHKLRQYLKKH
jgi:hypothetical protein